MFHNNIIILMPVYHPSTKIITICDELLGQSFGEIVVVSDGNEEDKYKKLLKSLEEMNVTVLYHAANQGKGRALKTGFHYIYLKYVSQLEETGILTIDADGQHAIDSIVKCGHVLDEHLGAPNWIMGCRDFRHCIDENGKVNKVPFRSYFGNEITKCVLKILCGISLSDTQTGLRGMPCKYLPNMIQVDGERYEYEMNLILHAKETETKFVEVPIKTIYENGNTESHFNPLIDSWKIYRLLFKYSLSSLISVLVEYAIFILSINSGIGILISNYMARLCSAGINFYVNKRYVFKNKGKIWLQMIQYIILCVISINISSLFLYATSKSGILNVIWLKIIIDTILYLCNYIIQSNIIFRKRNKD